MYDSSFDILDHSISDASKEGVFMPYKNKLGDPVSVSAGKGKASRELGLVLLGPEAGETVRVFTQLQQRAAKKDAKHSPSDAEIEADRVADARAISRLVVGGLLYSKGKFIDVTRENVGDYLYAVGPLRQQAVAFVLDSGNFTAEAAAKRAA